MLPALRLAGACELLALHLLLQEGGAQVHHFALKRRALCLRLLAFHARSVPEEGSRGSEAGEMEKRVVRG